MIEQRCLCGHLTTEHRPPPTTECMRCLCAEWFGEVTEVEWGAGRQVAAVERPGAEDPCAPHFAGCPCPVHTPATAVERPVAEDPCRPHFTGCPCPVHPNVKEFVE